MRFFSCSRGVLVAFGSVVLIQAALHFFGQMCGWTAAHGASIASVLCLAASVFFLLPSAVFSSGLAYAPAFVVIVLNGVWAYFLACLAMLAYGRFRA